MYASGTAVSAERTKAEIEHTLRRYGATQFVTGWDAGRNRVMVGFRVADRDIKFILCLPDSNDESVTKTERGRNRAPGDVAAFHDRLVKQKWRALLLVIKAKLESVEGGIETIEQAFLPQIVLPGGRTVGEWAHEAIPEAYKTGKMPSSLLLLN